MTLPVMDKVKEIIKKLKTLIENNKYIAYLIIGVTFIMLIFLSALFSTRTNIDLALIEQPLLFYKNKKVIIDNNTLKSFKSPKSKEVYKIVDNNQNIKVEGILSSLQINTPNKDNVSNIIYNWANKDGDLVSYDVKTQVMNISLANRKNIFPSVADANDEQLKQLFLDFTKKYIDKSYEYKDININKTGLEYIIEGRRYINGLPLSPIGSEKYSDKIVLDSKFLLKRAQFLLVTIDQSSGTKLSIVNEKDLNDVASIPSYPRLFNASLPEGLNFDSFKTDPLKDADYFPDDPIPSPTTHNVTDIELVYAFSNISQQFLTPVFRMKSNGKIAYKGNEYQTNVVIFLSAIDPEYVYIPSNIVYAD